MQPRLLWMMMVAAMVIAVLAVLLAGDGNLAQAAGDDDDDDDLNVDDILNNLDDTLGGFNISFRNGTLDDYIEAVLNETGLDLNSSLGDLENATEEFFNISLDDYFVNITDRFNETLPDDLPDDFPDDLLPDDVFGDGQDETCYKSCGFYYSKKSGWGNNDDGLGSGLIDDNPLEQLDDELLDDELLDDELLGDDSDRCCADKKSKCCELRSGFVAGTVVIPVVTAFAMLYVIRRYRPDVLDKFSWKQKETAYATDAGYANEKAVTMNAMNEKTSLPV